MADRQPGERPSAAARRPARRLDRPPGERYVAGDAAEDPLGGAAAERRATLFGPVVKAVVAAALGSVVLYALGALLSSSGGLLFVAGLTGAAVGLLLARAAAPGGDVPPAMTRRGILWSAVALTMAAIVLASIGTWLHALAEGGALGLVDYLLETFGIVVPAELGIGAVAAAWGAGAGPVER